MATVEVKWPSGGSTRVYKYGKSKTGTQRYICPSPECKTKTFRRLEYRYEGAKPGIDEKIITMAVNASGIRDTAGNPIFYTDDWGSYQRNLPSDAHIIGKKNPQTIERKNLTLRTKIKRLCRKTMCFSKSEIIVAGQHY